jgi:hypothetical protein
VGKNGQKNDAKKWPFQSYGMKKRAKMSILGVKINAKTQSRFTKAKKSFSRGKYPWSYTK